MNATRSPTFVRNVGRYVLFEPIARGGMATVHLGRLRGPAGFKRTVAIKRLHEQYASDPEFVTMFLDEARLAARIQHPNVVPVLDVVAEGGELYLVMDYVHGDSLSNLLRSSRNRRDPPPPRIIAQIMTSVLYGLHAAHEARSDRGMPLEIVHRDVSPQNVIVGVDGAARVLDFGVAKAAQKVQQTTEEGVVKGKVAYMPPEQLEATSPVDRRVDIYSAGVVMWEALTGRRMYEGLEVAALVKRILTDDPPPPSRFKPDLPPAFDGVVLKALSRSRDERYATALAFAQAIEQVLPPVPMREVAEWVARVGDDTLRSRADLVSKTEKVSLPPPSDSRESFPDTVGGLLLQRASRPEIEVSGTTTIVDPPRDANVVQEPPPRRRTAIFVAGGVGALLVVIGLLLIWRALAPKEPVAASPTPSGIVSSSAVVPTAVSSAPPEGVGLDPVPSAKPSSSPAGSAPPGQSATGTRTAAPRRNCDPPWKLDARGVRVLKRECL